MIRYALAAALIIAPVTTLAAQMETGGHMGHDHQMQYNAGTGMQAAETPKEPGQGAFAAIQEIVSLLVANPETDWSKVDIPALRAHLVDMNNVTLHARVEAAPEAVEADAAEADGGAMPVEDSRFDTTFDYPGGVGDFVTYLNENRSTAHKPVVFKGEASGIEVEVAFQYNDGYTESLNSFVNCINTVENTFIMSNCPIGVNF